MNSPLFSEILVGFDPKKFNPPIPERMWDGSGIFWDELPSNDLETPFFRYASGICRYGVVFLVSGIAPM